MDQKLKNYSSGMQVRLAFSVAIRAESDILILDEVLAVGDEAFQRKCNDYFFKAKREGKTVVLVTHSMENVRQFCDRAILIDDGFVLAEGNPDKVASKYSKIFINEHAEELRKESLDTIPDTASGDSEVTVELAAVMQAGIQAKVVAFREDFSVKFVFNSRRDYKDLRFAAHVVDQAGRIVLDLSTRSLDSYELHQGKNSLEFIVQNIFTEGEYYLNYAVRDLKAGKMLLKEQEQWHFGILGLDAAIHNKDSLTHPEVDILVNK